MDGPAAGELVIGTVPPRSKLFQWPTGCGWRWPLASLPLSRRVDQFSRVLEHRRGDPHEGDRDTGEGGIEVMHAVQVVELVKVAALERGDHDFRNPASEENKRHPHRNEPSGEQQELDLFFHRIDARSFQDSPADGNRPARLTYREVVHALVTPLKKSTTPLGRIRRQIGTINLPGYRLPPLAFWGTIVR